MMRAVAIFAAGVLCLALLALGPQLSYGMFGPLVLKPLSSPPPPPTTKVVVGAWGSDQGSPCTPMGAFESWLGITAGSAHNLYTTCVGVTGSYCPEANPGLSYLETQFSLCLGSPAQNRPQTIGVEIDDTPGNITGGTWDGYLQDVGEAINCCAGPNVVFRFDWEFNGNWTWFYTGDQSEGISGNNGYTQANFIQVWQHVVTIVRQYAPKVKVDWTPSICADGCPDGDPFGAYPGDAYVDIMSIDAYDTNISGNPEPYDWDTYFLGNATTGRGLAWQVAYAQAHGKGLSMDETALGDASSESNCTSQPTSADDAHGAGLVPYEAAWVKNTSNVNGYEPYLYFHWWNANLGGYCAIINGGLPFSASSGSPYSSAQTPPSSFASQYEVPQTSQAFYTAFAGWQ
jgi:Glycosyl hydrolase family 26